MTTNVTERKIEKFDAELSLREIIISICTVHKLHARSTVQFVFREIRYCTNESTTAMDNALVSTVQYAVSTVGTSI